MPLTAPQIRKSFTQLKPKDAWSFRNAARGEMNAHTHGYHRYPAKFIPQLVQQFIKNYAPKGDEIICDPFGGCGTTLVEAKISGRRSIGFDINPVAKLITQTKVTPISPKLLEKYRAEFLVNYKKARGTTIKHHDRISYWFDGRTVRSLDQIYLGIRGIKNANVRRFFLCAFSHNLKNCSRWLMKGIKPQIDPDKLIPKPLDSFLRHLDSMIRKNQDFYTELKTSERLEVPASMYRRDSTQPLPLADNSVDLIITSPPYVTSYEYADLHQLSLLWFGDDPRHFKKWHKFSNEFSHFRTQFIGTSFKNVRRKFFESTIADEVVTALEEVDRRLAADVANYFSDMRKVFSEMRRILKKGGKACLIIGNTEMKGVEILNAEIASEQMTQLGFKKVRFIKREVTNKLITSWRDKNTGKFTNLENPSKKRIYGCEYVIVMEK
jgi:DNA modification methylase